MWHALNKLGTKLVVVPLALKRQTVTFFEFPSSKIPKSQFGDCSPNSQFAKQARLARQSPPSPEQQSSTDPLRLRRLSLSGAGERISLGYRTGLPLPPALRVRRPYSASVVRPSRIAIPPIRESQRQTDRGQRASRSRLPAPGSRLPPDRPATTNLLRCAAGCLCVPSFFLSCGASEPKDVGGISFIPDDNFISLGNKSSLNNPSLMPILQTVRYFPETSVRKYCFLFPAVKGGKYLVRTTYFYGGFDGGKEPPVFNQIIGGSLWSVVNTTEDFANGGSSYYEIVVSVPGKTLSVCLAKNKGTTGGSPPFISAIEVVPLDGSMYNSTDFDQYALHTIARSTFGNNKDLFSFPDDEFNRLWQPFTDQNPVVISQSNVTASDFWNRPPVRAFGTAISTYPGKVLEVLWPPFVLPSTHYYVALYFQDNRTPSPFSWRVFSISVNDKVFASDINVTSAGLSVASKKWPLSGQTKISLTPEEPSPVGPLINAAEVFQLLPFGGGTLSRDVVAMEDLAKSFNNCPPDWRGDPCLPADNSWTGVTCSKDKRARVLSMDLSNKGISGPIPPTINNLTALQHLWLGGNQLSGTIPEMGSLISLETLHLENNKLTGSLPASLGKLPHLREIYAHNNNLDPTIPASLKRSGLNIQI